MRLPHPVFEGDTVYSRSEVLELRESKSRKNVGIVTVRTTGFNQDGTEVISFKRTAMILPARHRPRESAEGLGLYGLRPSEQQTAFRDLDARFRPQEHQSRGA